MRRVEEKFLRREKDNATRTYITDMTGKVQRTEAWSIICTADRIDDTGQCPLVS